MLDIPLGLRHAIESTNCVLFVGAGVGHYLLDAEGKSAPDGNMLTKELCDRLGIDAKAEYDLSTVSKVFELRKGRKELEAFLRKRLANLEPSETLKTLFSFRWKAIYTTNYDNGIQRSYELLAAPKQRPITASISSEVINFDSRLDVPIYYLHGVLFGVAKPLITITEDDYIQYRQKRKMLFDLLKHDLATSTILYVGYSNKDPNWKAILSEITEDLYPAPVPTSYRVAPGTDPLQAELLKSRGVETIDAPLDEFANIIAAMIPNIDAIEDTAKKFGKNVPSDLLQAFQANPAATIRLLSSWDYVNQASLNEPANNKNFLRGDRPNWGLVASREYFERDIEEDIYSELLDFATGTGNHPSSRILLGSAGYGVTTLLMALAAKLVNDRAGAVFMLKPGHSVIEGDIEFAISALSGKHFFFVDNAADQSNALYTIIHQLKEAGKPAMFMLGERINEWHQNRGKMRANEFLLEPLSDPEIIRLLDYLGKHNALNKLELLDTDMRFHVIKEKHQKELLVAMRESTENNTFDAIIEDEFRGIVDPIPNHAYLVVCCFYQHGIYVRDGMLSQLLALPLTQLYQEIGTATEGVIIFDLLDESKLLYGARARHRTIATVVWQRCGSRDAKEKLLMDTLNILNLAYASDRQAFEFLYSEDRMVDTIRSFEGKVKFFESACKKDPQSPYVRQHYARMLSRDEKYELALSQIQEALNIDGGVRILYHTKAVILMAIALNSESREIGRRRLVQSEESFNQAIKMQKRDEYCYQGLAQLYLGWAKKAATSEEAAEYIAKAEGAINEGLKNVRVRDGLWIESSKIQAWLGDEPSRLSALERAVAETPGSIVARYLLARTYRRAKRYQDAVNVLDYVVKHHHDEFRCFVEYAMAKLSLGSSYSDAIAILNLSTTFGLSDPRFIAILGGLYFLNQEFTEAQKVFKEAAKHDFTANELNAVQFKPRDPSNMENLLLLKGKVIDVKAGYCFIESPPYPTFLCPASKYEGTLMTKGLHVSFEPGFCAKGAIAVRPQSVK